MGTKSTRSSVMSRSPAGMSLPSSSILAQNVSESANSRYLSQGQPPRAENTRPGPSPQKAAVVGEDDVGQLRLVQKGRRLRSQGLPLG